MKQQEKNRLKRAARKLAGLCEYCGHEDPNEHKTSCKHYHEWTWTGQTWSGPGATR